MLSKTTPRICASILNLTSTPNFSSQCLRFLITTTTTTTPQFSTTTITQRPSQRSHAFRSSSTSSSPTYQSSLRSISTSTPPTTTTTTTTSPLPPSSSSSLTDQQPLTWDAYLRLRRKRRHYNLLASLLTSMNTTAAGVTFLGSQNFELMNIFGLDPFLALGAFTVVSGGVGWLLGPFVGNIIFGVVYRRIRGAIAAKDKDFYERIKRYRVDPSGQSVSNPVPDYYGEKIGSVVEFRHWMKDQRAYNKKRGNFL